MKNKQYHFCDCWVDSINLSSLIPLLFLCFRHNCRAVRYLKSSGFVSKAIRLFRLEGILNLRMVLGDCPEMTSPEEREVYHQGYRQKSELTLEIARRRLKGNSFAEGLAGSYGKDKINFFFKQEIASDIADFMVIYNFIKWFNGREDRRAEVSHIVLIRRNPWLPELAEFGKEAVEKIYGYPDLKRLFLAVSLPLKMLFEAIVNSFLLVFPMSRLQVTGSGLPKVGVMHAHGADLNKRSDYFWFPYACVKPERLLVYFKYDCWPPKKDTVGLIESYGISWVDVLPWKLRGLSIAPELYRLPHPFFVKRSLGGLAASGKLFLRYIIGRDEFPFWQWAGLINLINRVSFYESFFRIFNIKVHYSLYETGIDMIAANIAMGLNGGLDICHHWSNYDVTEISIGKPYDVYFNWGPYYKEQFFDRDYYEVKYLVYTGYPYDCQFAGCRERAGAHRKRLLNNGAKFIIAFFDQSYPGDWPKANEDIESIYRALFHYLIENPDFGLIVKPKKSKDFREKIKKFSRLAGEAEKTGRYLCLDPAVFPNEAAQAADLVVGFGVYSTPALESALSGIRAVTCDLQDFSKHPFYAKGYNSIVFNSLGGMLSAISAFKDGQRTAEKIGSYSFLLDKIDPFRDGRAAERMGRFIADLIAGFDGKIDSQAVIKSSVEKYRKAWGEDKVVYGIS